LGQSASGNRILYIVTLKSVFLFFPPQALTNYLSLRVDWCSFPPWGVIDDTKLLPEITKTGKATEKRQPEKIWQRKMTGHEKGQRRTDGNSCLGNRKKWQPEKWAFISFTSCCHTDDAAAGLCYMGLPEYERLPKTSFMAYALFRAICSLITAAVARQVLNYFANTI